MPALAPISANVPLVRPPAAKQDARAAAVAATPPVNGAKRRVKASTLCYTPPAMINDRKRDRSYFRRGLLGEGGFARCFEVTDFQGTRLAAKCIAKSSITSEKVKMKLVGEIKVHKSLEHPNIVKQRDCFEDDVNVYMILDICTQGTLMDMLKQRKRFSEPEVRFFGLQILGATKYMHSRRVIHRDLKLGNLFLDEAMNIKVGDFGLAALLVDDDDRKKTICGTPNYIAPEVLFGSAEGHSYEVDLWSIGVIFYAMLVGKPPFQSKEVKAIYAKIKVNEYDFPEEAQVSPLAQALIRSLLSTDPENRPSIDDIADHAFFNTGVMPRSIPPTATKEAPSWPAGQSSSVFRRNLSHVCFNAGIGRENKAGKQHGQLADSVVERPEQGRYLPVSLSPRTGPAAQIVDVQAHRTGVSSSAAASAAFHGQASGKLADRLQAVKASEGVRLAPPPPVPTKSAEEMAVHQAALAQVRETKQSAMRSGAVRPAAPPRTAEDTAEGAVSRLRGAVRVLPPAAAVAEPITKPVTRSTRYASLQAVSEQAVSNVPAPLDGPTTRTRAARRALANEADLPRSTALSSGASRQTSREASPGPVTRPSSTRTHSSASRASSSSKQTPVTEAATGVPLPSINPATVVAGDATVIAQTWLALSKALLDGGSAATSTRSTVPGPGSLASVHAALYVTKWVDYSDRYGLGYQLSNGATGVSFNDGTKMIHRDSKDDIVDFWPADSLGNLKARLRFQTKVALPDAYRKKFSLLKHFRSYMAANLNHACPSAEPNGPFVLDVTSLSSDQSSWVPFCHMTHYMRTGANRLFRLSDGTIQINFSNHAKVMVTPKPGTAGSLVDAQVRFLSAEKQMMRYRSLAEARQRGGADLYAKLAEFGKILQQNVDDL